MTSSAPHLRPAAAAIWVPLVSGLFWLVGGAHSGVVAFLLSALPGCLLIAGGVAALRLPGDPRKFQLIAQGGLAGAVLALPMLLAAGPLWGVWLCALSVASFVAAGWASQRREPPWEDVPASPPGVLLAAKVALDEVVLGSLAVTRNGLLDLDLGRMSAEVDAALTLFEARGWLEKPASFHAEPPALGPLRARRAQANGLDFEHVLFESGFEPPGDGPAAARWLARRANRTGHAWLLRHADGEPRPWLICVHGYGMGAPWIDLAAFDAARLHRDLGLNLLFPVLPLHGPRRAGLGRDEVLLGGDLLDATHGAAQAVWDIRRLLGWVRAQGATSIGVYGLSLGGYTAALVASLDSGLDCVIAGIPVSDFARLIFRLVPALSTRELARVGLPRESIERVLRVVSPLVLEPKVVPERRFIFGGTADRIVTADQVRDLWRHWGEPEIGWYAGTHFSYWREPEVRRLIDRGLREWRLG